MTVDIALNDGAVAIAIVNDISEHARHEYGQHPARRN